MARATTDAPIPQRLYRSLRASAGTIVFGMMDGTVSIFGLIFGVAATTTSTATVLIAGASGAAAAAVSMMAGAYLDVETSRDQMAANQAPPPSDTALSAASADALLSNRLAAAGLTPARTAALVAAVQHDPEARAGLWLALQADLKEPLDPREQALWMLLVDFLSAAVPILPFVLLPIAPARFVSGAVTLALLVGLGVGRARIAKRSVARTVAETVAIGIAAALAGVAIGVLFDRWFG
jgi:VIT1/CCC1 family predicted Fe2+/Mn2+ transporter